MGLFNPLDIGLRLAKTGFGIAQTIKANKQLKKLKMPTYKTPEEISQITDMYKQRASATEMPGQRRFEENLGQAYAEGVSEAQRTASSSLMATGAATDLAGKRMQAIQDLAGQFAEFKAQRQQELAGALQTQADYRDQEFKLNQYDPYFMERNKWESERSAGIQNMFGGAESTANYLSDLQGTNAYLDILKQLGQQGSGNKGVGMFDLTQFGNTGSPRLSAPSYSPSTSWKSYKGQIKI